MAAVSCLPRRARMSPTERACETDPLKLPKPHATNPAAIDESLHLPVLAWFVLQEQAHPALLIQDVCLGIRRLFPGNIRLGARVLDIFAVCSQLLLEPLNFCVGQVSSRLVLGHLIPEPLVFGLLFCACLGVDSARLALGQLLPEPLELLPFPFGFADSRPVLATFAGFTFLARLPALLQGALVGPSWHRLHNLSHLEPKSTE